VQQLLCKMFSAEENESREEQRLARSMNPNKTTGSIGRSARGRPTSWNVPGANAPTVAAKKNEQAQALRELQAQIEREQAQAAASKQSPDTAAREAQHSDEATPWDPTRRRHMLEE